MKQVSINLMGKITGLALMVSASLACAEDIQPFQPFDIASDNAPKSTHSTLSINSRINNFSSGIRGGLLDSNSGFDFLSQQDNGYHLSTNKEGLFGDELVVGMKFADWLTLRLNVIEESDSIDLFSAVNYPSNYRSDSDLVGYQFGVSSVMNISKNWRLGIDLGRGKVGGDLAGLYQDHMETTRLGFGIRNQKFGATFQSDFMNRSSNNEFEQATMDLQVDWHFTRDGTISFGARRSVNENSTTTTTLDQLRGTVPYIKFKHNL